MPPWSRHPGVIAVVSVILAMLIAIGYVASHAWVREGDLIAMLFWSAIFSVPLSLVLAKIERQGRAWRAWLRYLVLALTGAMGGMAWSFFSFRS